MSLQAHATRIAAVRHGETAWNVDGRIQGQLDIPLNDRGKWQAERVAAALADDGLQAIVSSDLSRAHETALAIGRATGLPVLVDAGLRERSFGQCEGQTWAEMEAASPQAAARWRARDVGFAPPGGETLSAFQARSLAAVRRVAAEHAGRSIAIVAHGGVMDCLYRAATGTALDAPRSWELANAAINRLLWSGEHLCLIGWSDTAHLDGPHAEPDRDATDVAPRTA